ncbi:MAG: hypothetical protein ACXVCI_01675 [Bdellovibrionota bacterium]
MKAYFALLAILPCLAAHAEEKPPKWSLVVSQNGDQKTQKTYELAYSRQIVSMEGNNWTCATVPDPNGDKFKMGIVCTFEKQSVSMPVICHEKMPKVSTLTVGTEKFFTALALLCEPHRGRTTPVPGAPVKAN